ncbi:ABC transporter permease [Salininema proteolyticum]|uniref:Transport permease protein n=1 Tax=Salininema proteolyticum TaxID=1607685 RepID=A0ABV8TW46_9ACTN
MTTTAEKTAAPALSDTPQRAEIRALLAGSEQDTDPTAWGSVRAFTWRALLRIKHVPAQLVDVTIWPVVMLVLFTLMFGGAIAGTTGDYIQYLLPGMLVMTIVMITMYTGISVANDNSKGVSDRFRTLPIWRPAPMVGFLLADAVRYTVAGAFMLVTGLIMGYRPEGGAGGVLLGTAVVLAFSFCVSWIWTWIGLIVSNEKTVMSISTTVLFPLTFLSSIMVDPSTMPSWLEPVVANTPISNLADSVRGFFTGEFDATATLLTAAWSAALLVVFGSLTLRAYNRS